MILSVILFRRTHRQWFILVYLQRAASNRYTRGFETDPCVGAGIHEKTTQKGCVDKLQQTQGSSS